MAVEFYKNNNGEQTNAQSQHQNTNGKEAIGMVYPPMGFNPNFTVVDSSRFSEYTTLFLEGMKEALKNCPTTGVMPNLHVINEPGFAYTCILSSVANDDQVFFNVAILEKTGKMSPSANDIISAYTSAYKNPQYGRNELLDVYVPGDAIDKILISHIIGILHKQYPTAKDVISLDGVVVPATETDPKLLATSLARVLFNLFNTEIGVRRKGDITITAGVKSLGNQGQLETDIYFNSAHATDVMGSPIRADLTVTLAAKQNNTAVSGSINMPRARENLGDIRAFMDAIPETVPVTQPVMGQAPVMANRLHPELVITSIDPLYGTTGYILMNLAAATVLSKPDVYMEAALPKNNSMHSHTALNVLCNTENSKNGVGAIPDVKKYQTSELLTYLTGLYSLAPVISLDVPSAGVEAPYLSIFGRAADGSAEDSLSARNAIVKSLSQLTGGKFPENFPLDEIFIHRGVLVPLGYWFDKNGNKRDIRDIDMAFIAHVSNGNVQLLNEWVLSKLPREFHANGKDPFITKLEVISKLIPDGVTITGKALRVTFSAKFIQALTTAAMAAGFVVRYAPRVQFADDRTFMQVGSLYADAGVQSLNGFNPFSQGGNISYGGMSFGYASRFI